jgi:hypothetical protein
MRSFSVYLLTYPSMEIMLSAAAGLVAADEASRLMGIKTVARARKNPLHFMVALLSYLSGQAKQKKN